jgi:hypothetical protein
MRLFYKIIFASLLATTGWFGPVYAASIDVHIGDPVYIPADQFIYDGYYRTRDGRYYYYDNDHRAWHWGRDHDEGRRWESRRERWMREHHENHDHD